MRNKQTRPLQTVFESETRFDVIPAFTALRRGPLEAELDQLKSRLLDPYLAWAGSGLLRQLLRSTANEAASLAWTTPFPLLFFPEILKEKLTILQRQAAFQDKLNRRSGVVTEAA